MAAAGGISYDYDGAGQRVKKSGGSNDTLYWYGQNGEVLLETDLAGNLQNEYIFFNGQRVARHDLYGYVDFYLGDHLTSTRLDTDVFGNPLDDSDYYPFGGERVVLSNSSNHYKFTDLERDSESGLDHTLFRQYSSTQGRWMTPDPAGMAAADPANPQSWNRYAYVMNRPTMATDPLGLFCGESGCPSPEDDVGDSGGGGGGGVDPFILCALYGYCGARLPVPIGLQGGDSPADTDPGPPVLKRTKSNPPNNAQHPCKNATISQRMTAGIQGTLNVGMGELKTLGFAALGVAGVAGAPESGGTSLFATAAAGYGIATSQGQVTSGMGQLVTAISGNRSAGQGIQQVGDIISGPLLGVPTLVATKNPAMAQRAANAESFFTAGTGWVNSKRTTEWLQGAVDFGLSTIGLTSEDGCN